MNKIEQEIDRILASPRIYCGSDCCDNNGTCEHCKEPVDMHVKTLTKLIQDKCEQAFEAGEEFEASTSRMRYRVGIDHPTKSEWIKENITGE